MAHALKAAPHSQSDTTPTSFPPNASKTVPVPTLASMARENANSPAHKNTSATSQTTHASSVTSDADNASHKPIAPAVWTVTCMSLNITPAQKFATSLTFITWTASASSAALMARSCWAIWSPAKSAALHALPARCQAPIAPSATTGFGTISIVLLDVPPDFMPIRTTAVSIVRSMPLPAVFKLSDMMLNLLPKIIKSLPLSSSTDPSVLGKVLLSEASTPFQHVLVVPLSLKMVVRQAGPSVPLTKWSK